MIKCAANASERLDMTRKSKQIMVYNHHTAYLDKENVLHKPIPSIRCVVSGVPVQHPGGMVKVQL